MVVLAGAYVMNAGYALILLVKNKSFSSFKTPNMFSALKWAIIAGLLWFAASGTFGQGVALMGDMGTMICWPMMLGLSLIVSNAVRCFHRRMEGNGRAAQADAAWRLRHHRRDGRDGLRLDAEARRRGGSGHELRRGSDAVRCHDPR